MMAGKHQPSDINTLKESFVRLLVFTLANRTSFRATNLWHNEQGEGRDPPPLCGNWKFQMEAGLKLGLFSAVKDMDRPE